MLRCDSLILCSWPWPDLCTWADRRSRPPDCCCWWHTWEFAIQPMRSHLSRNCTPPSLAAGSWRTGSEWYLLVYLDLCNPHLKKTRWRNNKLQIRCMQYNQGLHPTAFSRNRSVMAMGNVSCTGLGCVWFTILPRIQVGKTLICATKGEGFKVQQNTSILLYSLCAPIPTRKNKS